MIRIPYAFFFMLLFYGCNQKKTQKTTSLSEIITNPIVDSGADPWIIRQGSTFHYCYAKGGGIYVKSVQKFSNLNGAEEHVVWQAPDTGSYSREVWAPELHKIDSKWYVYFAADDGENKNHRMHVLSSSSDIPHSGFSYAGKVSDDTDKWAIDGTVFTLNGKTYFVWSGWEGEVNEAQHLYIAEMSSPTQISSERVRISSPEFEWEKRGSSEELPTINEGPQVLQKGGRTFIVYSASGSWSNDYCLGLLELKGGDPMLPDLWEKSERPVFSGTEQVISPGHASFIISGGQDYIVYHAMPVKGGGWASRQVRIQPFSWKEGKPDFGVPVENEVEVNIEYFTNQLTPGQQAQR
ncbi:glycoside hydrolase family 43 protein [Imperialibacter roseus]|uniref:Glycoside hydrolase family 43 protein n=1 Tax=Imperialibacter roseus TaxID=1324217 RepID=A0ABZ0J0C5_9BACT|nr:glycoside hydrolase family 43 protein [Imperialibacter roseus]WOK09381.1 glycoside hydrolase family 43 protein [Imperialibacter roseus]